MRFGIPQEIRNHEHRVGATPWLVESLVKQGHDVFVENGAGERSHFGNAAYEQAGAQIAPSPEKLYGQTDYILKIRAPKPVEYDLIEPHHTVFAFFQFFNYPEMSRSLMARGGNCFGYELFELENGVRPLLDADRMIASQLALQQGAYYLQRHHGGRGAFIGFGKGVTTARVTIVGGSFSGVAAANLAATCGASVRLLAAAPDELAFARERLRGNVLTDLSDEAPLEDIFASTDLLICANQRIERPKYDKISAEMVSWLPKGAVLVDLDVEYDGGSVETSHVTKIDNPTYSKHGVIHYCAPNLAGSVPLASSPAHSRALLPVLTRFADHGFASTMRTDKAYRSGLAIYEGHITHAQLAEELNLSYFDLSQGSE